MSGEKMTSDRELLKGGVTQVAWLSCVAILIGLDHETIGLVLLLVYIALALLGVYILAGRK